jgi:hypothetical protein
MPDHRYACSSLVPWFLYAATATAVGFVALILAGVLPHITG